jgi:hypothetical protein
VIDIEALRACATDLRTVGKVVVSPIGRAWELIDHIAPNYLAEAAEEIERLHAELKRVVDYRRP